MKTSHTNTSHYLHYNIHSRDTHLSHNLFLLFEYITSCRVVNQLPLTLDPKKKTMAIAKAFT